MADQFSALELLLDPEDQLADPIKRKATAAALRRQNAYGTLGQLMGVQPTQQAGVAIQEGAQQSLRSVLAKQQAAKEAASRKAEREQAQANWLAEQQRQAARDAEQRRQFGVQEARLGAQQNQESKRQWAHAVDPVTGTMRLYNQITGEWSDGVGGQPQGNQTAGLDIPIVGAANVPGAGKLTESQRTGAVRSGEGTIAIRNALNAGFPDEGRISSLPDTAMYLANRAGFPQVASERVQAQSAFWSNVADPIVRARTGAAMPVEEFNNQMAMLVPRPGEAPAVQMQKAQQLVAFLKSGTVGLPPQVQQHLLAQLAQIEGAIPKTEMEWMQMRKGGTQTPAQQAPTQPSSGRNFEAEYGLGGK